MDVDAFGKQAEVIAQYLRKGRSLLVEGRLKLDSWDDKQTGQKKSKLGVGLESFSFLDSGNRGEGGAPSAPSTPSAAPRPARPAPSAPPPASDGMDGPPPDDDDVPF